MIKEIFFTKTDSLNDEKLKISFSEKINIIIGPKGGGKSTLFDLLAGLKKGYIAKNVIDALASFNLAFDKALKFNGEEITVNNLRKKTLTEKNEDFNNRNDVIFQDDPIKKNINSSSAIDKQKHEYLKNLLDNSNEIHNFISSLKLLYDNIKKICDLNNESEINWSNSFKMTKATSKFKLLVQLNYDNKSILMLCENEIQTIREILEDSKQQIVNLKRYSSYDFNKLYLDKNFNLNINQSFLNLINQQNQLLEILNKRNKFVFKIKNIVLSFKKAYLKIMDNIKKIDFDNEGIKQYEIQSKSYFKKTARELVETKKLFSQLLSSNVVLKLKSEPVNYEFLAYQIESPLILEDDQLDEILKVIFYSPSKSKNDISKWIFENKSHLKEFAYQKLINKIANVLKEKVIVLADGKNYEHMSLGQKSIYGIRYKFNNSKNEDLFLDQPEDNLDNHTIATNILEMISSKKNNQVFIVTHNANIGILTNPGKVIVADLNSKQTQYTVGTIVKENNEDSDSAFYLEGGTEYLEKRFRIIKGE